MGLPLTSIENHVCVCGYYQYTYQTLDRNGYRNGPGRGYRGKNVRVPSSKVLGDYPK